MLNSEEEQLGREWCAVIMRYPFLEKLGLVPILSCVFWETAVFGRSRFCFFCFWWFWFAVWVCAWGIAEVRAAIIEFFSLFWLIFMLSKVSLKGLRKGCEMTTFSLLTESMLLFGLYFAFELIRVVPCSIFVWARVEFCIFLSLEDPETCFFSTILTWGSSMFLLYRVCAEDLWGLVLDLKGIAVLGRTFLLLLFKN